MLAFGHQRGATHQEVFFQVSSLRTVVLLQTGFHHVALGNV